LPKIENSSKTWHGQFKTEEVTEQYSGDWWRALTWN